MIGICLVYSIFIYGICSFSRFRGQHHNRPDPVPQDIPDDVLPDPDELADFELPDPQALIDAFLDGLCKESDHEFRGLSHLLASLPDVLRHNCLFLTLYFHLETPRKFERRSLKNAGGFSTGIEHRAIAAKLRHVISVVNMQYTRTIMSYTRFRPGIYLFYK